MIVISRSQWSSPSSGNKLIGNLLKMVIKYLPHRNCFVLKFKIASSLICTPLGDLFSLLYSLFSSEERLLLLACFCGAGCTFGKQSTSSCTNAALLEQKKKEKQTATR